MTAAITVTCPGCVKDMRAPAAARGKKVRCKGCGHVFVVPAGPAKSKPAARAPGGKKAQDEGLLPENSTIPLAREEDAVDDDGKPYGVTTLDLTPRCPHCANEMEDGAVICLHCGYNTHSRDFHRTRKVADITGGDIFLWLLPGILCVILILVLIAFDLWYVLAVPDLVHNSESWEWLGAGAIRLWLVIGSLFAMYHAGKFAFYRLILNPRPPEVEV
jgi:hypothetical protein